MTSTTTPAPQAVRDASVAILAQLADTLGGFTDEQYTTPGPGGASVGAHIRHTLDHFGKLDAGYKANHAVAYDQRERGGSIETDRQSAIVEATRLADAFGGLDSTQMDLPVTIRAMVTGDGQEAEIESTLVRELWFASHHAIHHNALLKPIASAAGVELSADFGRAPSTVNHDSAGS